MKRFLLIAGLSLAAGSAWAGPTGTWRVTDGTANVEIVPCGDALCGVLAKTDKPDQKDTNNPDPSKRDRPVLGSTVLQNMKPQGDKWVGSVYNVRNGMTYDAKISMHGEDTLRMEGCIPGGVFCGGQDWSRVAPPSVAAAPAIATAQPQAKETALITPVPAVGKATPAEASQLQEAQTPETVPAQQQVTVAPQVTENTSRSPRLLDLDLSQITADQAAEAGRSAAGLINQMLTQQGFRGARVDPAQAALAARSATKVVKSMSTRG
jgi:uncharacterized protein (DUF2147 family)